VVPLADEKPPILGLLQRKGDVLIQMMPNVKQVTIKPVLMQVIQPGSLLYTDEYGIYTRLEEWGYRHKTVNHSASEYARDEDGDGFHEVHVNTLEGFWEFVHNARRRGNALLSALLSILEAP
jgi:transposase